MKLEKLFKAVAGAGVGALLAFIFVVVGIPDLTDVKTVLWIYLLFMIPLGWIFSRSRFNFRTSALSYLSGLGTVFALVLLSPVVSFGKGAIFIAILISLLIVLYPDPCGVLDVLLSGPLYFAGTTTVMAIAGALDLPGNSMGLFMVTVFIGFLGMIGVVTGAAARLLFAKPKP